MIMLRITKTDLQIGHKVGFVIMDSQLDQGVYDDVFDIALSQNT
ncbi:hypothetical protein L291_0142 [Acinetobacter guillouiae MSP4-18]|nr:hypothetical protein L291_0142 [Acinetobacter guillouiae MSP4-18]